MNNVGVAAHITGATPGARRYDAAFSSDERSAIENGIWLCQTHAKQIDSDEETWTVDSLKSMKEQAEVEAKRLIGRQQQSAPPVAMQRGLRGACDQQQAGVDWETFYALPSSDGPRSNTYLRLIAVPFPAQPVLIDGGSLEKFVDDVAGVFRTRPEPPKRRPYAYCHDLVWRSPVGQISRHWRRGQDGSVGYATTVESGYSRGAVSLWEVAIEALTFMRLARELLIERDVHLNLDFQPGALIPRSGPLAPADSGRSALCGVPPGLESADINASYQPATDTFSTRELHDPFQKIAAMLGGRWRVMFSATTLRPDLLAKHLDQLARSELAWLP